MRAFAHARANARVIRRLDDESRRPDMRASTTSRVARVRVARDAPARRARRRGVARGGEPSTTTTTTTSTTTSTRRDALRAIALATALAPALAARANPLDAVADARRAANARFLLGPIALARGRLAALRRELDDARETLDDAALRERLTSATLDCTRPRDSLEMYSNAREVCTLAILARSATLGPAARNPPESRESADVSRTLDACRAAFDALERVVASSSASVERERDAAFDACDAALLEFARALLACFRFDVATARDATAAVPGAFADPSASRRSSASF